MKVDVRQWWDPNPDGYPQTNKTKQRNKIKTNQLSLSLFYIWSGRRCRHWLTRVISPTYPPSLPFLSDCRSVLWLLYPSITDRYQSLSLSLSNKHYSLSNAPKQHIILSNAHTQTQTHANIFFSFASLCVCLCVCGVECKDSVNERASLIQGLIHWFFDNFCGANST